MTEHDFLMRAGDLLAGRYRLIDRIGAGGMSVIWRAKDETLDRLVALKVLDPVLAGDERLRELARREAWAVARLNHPDVAGVHDFVRDATAHGEEIAVIVLQLVAGEPLADRIALGPLPWREAVRIAGRVATVLEVAHRRGVVHRDITPDNIMLHGEQVTVLDFGIAARVGEPDDDSTGASFGTPAYVAPERLDGTPAQPATDVYALGVVLFEMLTGHPPFRVAGWDDVAADHGPVTVPQVPGLPRTVGRLVAECLERDVARRPSAAEAARVLRSALLGSGRKRLVPLGLTVAALAALGLAVWLLPLDDTDRPGAVTASPTVSPSAAVVVSPTAAPSASPSVAASPSVPANWPTGYPTKSPPPPPSPLPSAAVLTVAQARDAALYTLELAQSQTQVRSDVATDIANVIRNLAQNKPTGELLSQQLASLYYKLDQREDEGTLAAAAAQRLRGDVAALGRALGA
ncbi:protein kinase [Catellatospora sp. KI3]|uniref:serine/threonine-protein kinase n=1 Tax=Catellatospora sp. KI3 TaxID=3041620 RepID=UPI0024830FB0|nr:serine/threonine-protein kinase [Catellatospora sp. KI3]MDI1462369.1 protein kinase [Catellatospora sp. KI3]